MRARKQLFSIRMGYRKEAPPQIESLNPNTRIAFFYSLFTDTIMKGKASWSEFGEIFLNLRRNAIDGHRGAEILESVKKRAEIIFLEKDWFVVFDVIEWLEERAFELDDDADGWAHESNDYERAKFHSEANSILHIHGVGYSFIEGKFIPLSNDAESATVQDAAESPSKTVRIHISKAIDSLDRNKPEYANCIKESIFAVEGILSEITGENEFGKACKWLENQKAPLHPQFVQAMRNFYQFTSDVGGVRHYEKDEKKQEIDQEAAVCMLVTCSAIANYLAAKMPQLKKDETGKVIDDDLIPF